MSCFGAHLPGPTLFGPDLLGVGDSATGDLGMQSESVGDLEAVLSSVNGTMPVVLVMVHSSPRQLQSIEWAVAELDRESEEVSFRGGRR